MKKYVFAVLLVSCSLPCLDARAAVGEVWETLSTYPDNPFAGREGVALGGFQGKLWGAGGREFVCSCEPRPGDPCDCGFEYTYFGDLWVSDDGMTWELVFEHAPFGTKYLAAFTVFKDMIYITGGNYGFEYRSSNGLTWELISGVNALIDHPLLVFDEKLIVLGSEFYSTDGANWEVSPAYSQPPFTFTPFNQPIGLEATVHNDHIYAFQSQRVWRSPDGYAWTELEGNTDILEAASSGNNIAMASFAGYLWLAGIFVGVEAGGDGMVWKSSDGENWVRVLYDPMVDTRGPVMTVFDDYLLFLSNSLLLGTKASCQELLSTPHSSDRSGCGGIQLSELLRIVQFFSYGTFHCDSSSEDGYAPGPAPEGETEGGAEGEGELPPCLPHSSDYSPQDWHISLNELLRLIQLYNADSYTPCAEGESSEDGFCINQ